MRTDTVGDGKFTSTSAFVLVDAENRSKEGAYVSLGGDLTDATGAAVGHLKPQSIWIPSGETRTFALVDAARTPRPDATSARIVVRGALRDRHGPQAHIEDLHTFQNSGQDGGQVVVQAYLVNDADRRATIMVLGSFHDAENRPMTRPFTVLQLAARQRKVVQFVGPARSVRGTIFLGDITY